MIFSVFQKIGFFGILGPPYCGIGAIIRIGRAMVCLPYAGFFLKTSTLYLIYLFGFGPKFGPRMQNYPVIRK